MEIVERLEAYKEYTGLTNSQFADKAGIPRPTLSQFLNGRNKRLSDDLANKLHTTYPDLNILWLLFGEGDMLVDGNFEISEGKNGQNKGLFDDEPTDFQEEISTEIPIIESPQKETNEKKAINIPDIDRNQSVIPTNPTKKIKSIMVFYSDNSYEMFPPAEVR